MVSLKDIIAIIDAKTAMESKDTREFLKIAEEEGFVRKISQKPPESFILCEIKKNTVVFYSPISSMTLLKRSRSLRENVLWKID